MKNFDEFLAERTIEDDLDQLIDIADGIIDATELKALKRRMRRGDVEDTIQDLARLLDGAKLNQEQKMIFRSVVNKQKIDLGM